MMCQRSSTLFGQKLNLNQFKLRVVQTISLLSLSERTVKLHTKNVIPAKMLLETKRVTPTLDIRRFNNHIQTDSLIIFRTKDGDPPFVKKKYYCIISLDPLTLTQYYHLQWMNVNHKASTYKQLYPKI